MKLNDWNIFDLTGYEPKTTFYTDLSIADRYGKNAVREFLYGRRGELTKPYQVCT